MTRFILFIILGFLLIQLVRPKKNTSTDSSTTALVIDNTIEVPNSVKVILQKSCYDCHSNNTKYRWYHQIAPISWIVSSHVNKGKSHLNFDEFGHYNNHQKNHIIKGITKTINNQTMPLKGYIITHPKAKLTDKEREVIKTWASQIKTFETL